MKSTPLVYTLFFFQILMCVFLWTYSMYHYSALPNVIPIHYGIDGSPDGFGNKNTIFMFPILGTVLFVFMNQISKNPDAPGLNLSQNIKSNPKLTRVFVTSISTWVLVIFSVILFEEIQVIKNSQKELSPIVFFLVGGMLLYVIIFNLYHHYKK